MTPLRYSPEVERPEEGEQAAIDGIVAGMSAQLEAVEAREGRAVRASHAKSTACAVGTMTVPEGLAPELAQGLFARPATFDVAVRFAQGPGETLGDRVSTHRGMAVKVFGPPGEIMGETIPENDEGTQDFVLATGPTFASGTAKGFLRDGTAIGAAAALPEGVKSAASSLARNLNRVLRPLGAESARAEFFGHPFSHPFADSYFSQAPMRWGDHVAKVGAFPASPAQEAIRDWRLDPHQDEDGFRAASVAFLRAEEVVYELRAQLWTNQDTQPIEDASVEWPVEESPYQAVATIRLPRQEAHGEGRARFFDERLTFRPAHSLLAHRPLGSVMRARLQAYGALSALRHRETGVPEAHPAGVGGIPA